MGRLANDGRGRLGGRTKGTPNESNEPNAAWITEFLTRNRKRFAVDYSLSEPGCRAITYALLLVAQAMTKGHAVQPETLTKIEEVE